MESIIKLITLEMAEQARLLSILAEDGNNPASVKDVSEKIYYLNNAIYWYKKAQE